MPNVLIVNGNPTQGGTDGSLVTGINPVQPDLLTTGADAETAPLRLAIRTAPGYERQGPIAIAPQGANSSKWALAPDFNGSPGSWGSWGSALVLANTLTAKNLVFWIKARVTVDESYPILTNDTSVSLSVPDDAYLLTSVGRSLAQPFADAAAAGRSLSQGYTVRTVIGRSLSQSSAITGSAGRSLDQQYGIGGPSGRSAGLSYNINAAIGRSVGQPYPVRAAVGRSLDQPYGLAVTAFPSADANTVLQWRFDEGTGTALDDSGSNNYDGTITAGTGGAWSTTSPKNSLLSPFYDCATNGRISVSASASIGKAAGSFECVVKPDTIAPAAQMVLLREGVSGAGYFYVWIGTNGKLFMQAWRSPGTWNTIEAASALTAGTWYHLAATWDSSGQKLYVNGSEVATASQNGLTDTSTSLTQVSAPGRHDGDLGLDGKIAYVELSNAKRSGASILSRAQALGF